MKAEQKEVFIKNLRGAGVKETSLQLVVDRVEKGEPEFTQRIDPYALNGNVAIPTLYVKVDTNGMPHLNKFTLDFQPRIVIHHKVIEGIDTLELDKRMRAADWSIAPNKDLTGIPVETMQKVLTNAAIIEDLNKISSNRFGKHIGNLLAVKHWQDSPYSAIVPNFEALTERNVPKMETQTFPTQYSERWNIYNASAFMDPTVQAVRLKIRPFNNELPKGLEPPPFNGGVDGEGNALKDLRPYKAWIVPHPTAVKENGERQKMHLHKEYYLDAKFEQLDMTVEKPKFDLATVLNRFALIQLNTEHVMEKKIKDIENGKHTFFSYEKNGALENVFVTANPMLHTVRFLNHNGRNLQHKLIPQVDLLEKQMLSNNFSTAVQTIKQRVGEWDKQAATAVVTSAAINAEKVVDAAPLKVDKAAVDLKNQKVPDSADSKTEKVPMAAALKAEKLAAKQALKESQQQAGKRMEAANDGPKNQQSNKTISIPLDDLPF
ncbi:hypothetical protein GA0116948_11056 [Chitinophaga costaii]|uniref:Uncharacterized protein n=1 Tax=Chitinophaga costaii TaxID=1335309 RepID=A0A1C4EWI7_9BACT|nr:hypothetical protein [Chitinophaga costaii]PUZ21602.1 hypothetical protein DCM91_16345 [Chitinophaga costaii]SCC47882.1 hypothetical protein GA0116948_11056 [Chitinophaga costaii]